MVTENKNSLLERTLYLPKYTGVECRRQKGVLSKDKNKGNFLRYIMKDETQTG